MDSITVRLTGQSPLLMHNGQLANPFNKFAKAMKEVTNKRKKTEEDQLAIMRIEWEGGLYFDEKIGPYIPAENLESMINDGARLQKRGKDVERAVFVLTKKTPLIYDGPRTVEGMWEVNPTFLDYGPAVNPSSGGRTMRARPIFWSWAAEVAIDYRPDVIDRGDLFRFLVDAGQHVGLMDHRPRFGQFGVEVVGEAPPGNGKRAKTAAAGATA